MMRKIFLSGLASFGIGAAMAALSIPLGMFDQWVPAYGIPAWAFLIYGFVTFVLPCVGWALSKLSFLDWMTIVSFWTLEGF